MELEAQRLELEAERTEQEAQRQYDQRKLMTYSILAVIVLVVALIIGGGIFILFSKIRLHKEKQKTLAKEIEREVKHIESKEYELKEVKNKIKEIEKHKKIQEKEQRELDTLKSEAETLNSYIENQWEKTVIPFPYAEASNRLVVINPHLGGYICFYKKDLRLEDYPTDSLVHRWIWQKNNGRRPKPGYHIHHIDGNKYNNRIENLKEIEKEQHYALHRL